MHEKHHEFFVLPFCWTVLKINYLKPYELHLQTLLVSFFLVLLDGECMYTSTWVKILYNYTYLKSELDITNGIYAFYNLRPYFHKPDSGC